MDLEARVVDKSKRSNMKCEYCEHFGFGICRLSMETKCYWNCCKQFKWRKDKKYINYEAIMQYRPCFVGDKRALFHKWGSVSEIVPPSALLGGHNGGTVTCDFAIVEYEDGTVAEVKPSDVRFVDRLIEEYAFR